MSRRSGARKRRRARRSASAAVGLRTTDTARGSPPDATRATSQIRVASAAPWGKVQHTYDLLHRRTSVRSTDIVAVGEVAGEALAAGGTLVKDMHEGIAGRPFGALGPAAAPVRAIHDGIARAVYGGVRAALRGA